MYLIASSSNLHVYDIRLWSEISSSINFSAYHRFDDKTRGLRCHVFNFHLSRELIKQRAFTKLFQNVTRKFEHITNLFLIFQSDYLTYNQPKLYIYTHIHKNTYIYEIHTQQYIKSQSAQLRIHIHKHIYIKIQQVYN